MISLSPVVCYNDKKNVVRLNNGLQFFGRRQEDVKNDRDRDTGFWEDHRK